MGSHSGGKRISNLLVLLVLTAAIALLPSLGNAQKAHQKLTSQDVIDLLTNDTSSDDVVKAAQAEGISFQVTPSVEKKIRDVGGTDDLIRVLRSLAPHGSPPPPVPPHPAPPTSPPVLMVESRPGQCQVYVDDEPVGSTSQEGRLKMTRLAPGDHRVRVTQTGYQDYEENVTLTAGEVTTVAATLQQPTPTPIPPGPGPGPEPVPPNHGQAGYLGVQAKQQAAGARGVVVASTAPGGPAAQAGLQTNDVILAVNGQMVNTPQALRTALSSHQAGETVQITWYNGSTTVTRSIQLTGQQVPVPVPHPGVVSFAMAHDHGQSAQNYCTGVMTIGNGVISYKGTKGSTGNNIHSYDIPLDTIREARRNTVYLVNLGAFHIRTKKNSNFNFVALDQQGKPGPPDAVLTAIDTAMGR
jgi:hypothetical protein